MLKLVHGLLVGVFLLIGPAFAAQGSDQEPAAEAAAGPQPRVKVIPLEPGDQSYYLMLAGPPETKSMRSGLVTLAPGKSIGAHNTGKNEEMIIPLEGQGELRIAGRDPIVIKPGLVTYAPSHTEHDVVNTGGGRLRYIFVVARAD